MLNVGRVDPVLSSDVLLATVLLPNVPERAATTPPATPPVSGEARSIARITPGRATIVDSLESAVVFSTSTLTSIRKPWLYSATVKLSLAVRMIVPPYTDTHTERIVVRQREKEVLSGRLLRVIDESPFVVEAIAQAVHQVNGQAGEAASFDEMHALLEAPAEVVILDVNLPGMPGDRLAKVMLKNLEPPLPKVILFSGLEAADLRRIARKLGVIGWVKKGAPREDLLRAVEAAARFFRGQGRLEVPVDFSTPPVRQVPEPLGD